ncbi:hypothetical protein LIER_19492 [Lithospermum erythrorhizon]|uniref:Serine-rich protein-like protein n=1 Tax=Lithospermum erythrorhizon TaxID=34254 RepID=A0AAV3QI02_LITER
MAANSRRSNIGQTLRSDQFYSSNHQTTSYYSTSSAFASSSLSARTSQLLNRSTSPTGVTVLKSTPSSSQSIRFGSPPNRSVSVSRKPAGPVGGGEVKRTCACSPTSHPGSFRCSLHRRSGGGGGGGGKRMAFGWSKVERSAMANSLVRIGAVEGDLVKRALAALIRPSSHQLRRRENFQSRPSRLSVMSRD